MADINNMPLTDAEEAKLNEYWLGTLGMCGCGNPMDVKEMIKKMLDIQRKYKNEAMNWAERKVNIELALEDKDAVFEFIFHVLENTGLISHGHSIYGSLLTDFGKEILGLLNKEINSEK